MFGFIEKIRKGDRSSGRPRKLQFGKISVIGGLTGLVCGLLLVAAFSFGDLRATVTGSANGFLAGDESVDATGALNYTLPLKVAPGINGLTPTLSLDYNSRNKSPGILGVGWTLGGLPVISRCSKSLQLDGEVDPVEYNNSDRLCVGGMRLVSHTGRLDTNYWNSAAKYYTYEESWMEYEAHGQHSSGHGPMSFTAKTKNGNTLTFQLPSANGPYGIGRWHLSKIEDRNGNAMHIGYNWTGLTARPSLITYNTNHKIKFVYDSATTSDYDRQVYYTTDGPAASSTSNGDATRHTAEKRLKRIEMFSKGQSLPFKVYRFSYLAGNSLSTKRSLLNKIEECDGRYTSSQCLEPVDISWNNTYNWFDSNQTTTTGSGRFEMRTLIYSDFMDNLKGAHEGNDQTDGTSLYPGDFDGDGRTDFIKITLGDWTDNASHPNFCVYYANDTATPVTNGGSPKNGGEFTPVCPTSASYKDNSDTTRTYGDALKGAHGGQGVSLYVGDFNGDGLSDFLRVEQGQMAVDNTNTFNVFLSDGTRNGTFEVINPDEHLFGQADEGMQQWIKGPHDGAEAKGVNIILGDYNGDGRTDFIAQQHGDWADTDNGQDYGQDFSVYMSTITKNNLGEHIGSFSKQEPQGNGMSGSSKFRAFMDDGALSQSGCNIIPGDFNGDGMTDFIRQEYGADSSAEWTQNNVDNFEVYISRGSGEFYRVYSGNGTAEQKYLKGHTEYDCPGSCTTKWQGTNIIPGDFNGDGRTDFVAQRWGDWADVIADDGEWRTLQIYISKGNGEFEVETPFDDESGQKHFFGMAPERDNQRNVCSYAVTPVCVQVSGSTSANRGSFLHPVDVNGDGRTDLIRQEGGNIAKNNTVDTFQIYVSKGNGLFESALTPAGANYQARLKGSHENGSLTEGASLIFGDYDGDGLTDFLKQEHGGWVDDNIDFTFAVYLNPANRSLHSQPQETVQKITQGKLNHEITYGLMTDMDRLDDGTMVGYPADTSFRRALNADIWLVTQLKENPTQTTLPDRDANYAYGAGVAGDEGGFLGFRKTEISYPQKNIRVLNTYEFHALDGFRAARPNYIATYNNATGATIRVMYHAWSIVRGHLDLVGNSTFAMQLYRASDFDQAHTLSTSKITRYKFDGYMNITEKRESFTGEDDVYTCFDYNTDENSWVVDQVSSVQVGSAADCPNPLKRTDYGYDASGNMDSEKQYVTASSFLETTYSNFTAAGLPQTITKPSGLVRTIAYGLHGVVTSLKEGPHTTSFSNDATWGTWTTKTDPNLRVFHKTYDKFGRLLTESAPNNSGTSYQRLSVKYRWSGYNLVQDKRTRTNWSGNDRLVSTFRNAYGNLISKEESASGQTKILTQYTYNARDQKLTESLPAFSGGTVQNTTYSYDDDYFRLTRVDPPVGHALTLAYAPGNGGCQYGERETTRTRDDRVFKVCQHHSGQITRTELVATEGTKVQTRSYDRLRRATTISDGLTSTTYDYDMMGRLNFVDNNERGKIQNTYHTGVGHKGLLSRVEHFGTDGTTLMGKVQYNEFDSLKRPTKITYWDQDNAFRVVLKTYDQAGSCASFSNAKDRLCRTQVKDSTGAVVLTRVRGYDNSGSLKSLATTLNGTGTNPYTLAYEYGPMGNRTKVTYPNGREMDYTYDTMGRLDKVKEAVTGATTYADYNNYNAAGRAREVLVNNSKVKETHTFDDYYRLDNITIEKVSTGSEHLNQDVRYTDFGEIDIVDGTLDGDTFFINYDYNQWGFLTRADSTAAAGNNDFGTLSYIYDSNARLTNKTSKSLTYDTTRKYRVNAFNGQAVGYNLGGSVTSRVKSGSTYTYKYDANQQLIKVTSGGSTQAEFAYDENNERWKKIDSASGRIHYYISPEMDVHRSGSSWVPTHYINGAEGRIAAISDSGNGSNTALLEQRTHHRMLADLQSLKSIQGLVNWGYHTATLFVLHPAMPVAANYLLLLLLLAGLMAFAWSFLRSAQRNSALGRLRSQFADLLFDAGLLDGARAQAFAAASGTSFMRRNRRLSLAVPLVLIGLFSFQCANNNENSNGAIVIPGTGAMGAGFLASGLPALNQVRFYHSNKIGNVTLVTSDAGNVATAPVYKPFGEMHYNGPNNDTRYRFQDKEQDSTTGLYYFGARYYDPELGRFMQADSLAIGTNVPNAASLDRYAFAANNPINFADPTGNFAITTALLVSASIMAANAAVMVLSNFIVALAFASFAAVVTGQKLRFKRLMKEAAIGCAISLATAGVGAGLSTLVTRKFVAAVSFMKAVPSSGIRFSKIIANPFLSNKALAGVARHFATHPGHLLVGRGAVMVADAATKIGMGTVTTEAIKRGTGYDADWAESAKGAAYGFLAGTVMSGAIKHKLTNPINESLKRTANMANTKLAARETHMLKSLQGIGDVLDFMQDGIYGEFVGYGRHLGRRPGRSIVRGGEHRGSGVLDADTAAGYSVYSGYSGLAGEAAVPAYGVREEMK